MRFQSIIFSVLSLGFVGSSLALPVDSAALQKRAFTLKTYPEFQISSTPAGNAQAEAAAVFVTPFNGVDLATVSKQDRDNVEAMRRLAEQAETEQFNPAIKAASAKALQNGKIKNKVLKLTGIVQVSKIDLAKAKAAGKDTSSIEAKLEEEQTKLTKNIATDVAAAGQDSEGVV
ncbi:SubName: Full=Uncharacterized protein {ECO:0000313/EMBL:CCA74423.1} [Serendipita indica DSM 11827]|uniref:Small secreted protein n=1 Tax=Serendipita indica (strain DSM 11827) TaxID=1109443 RepID=G4TSY0_SERID|nr:SubName: Full=Uncharacterized protein {ECO:0000313/EMBL:CCA74423.1} [Serendipita indica DSM 11827]CCA74423.1 hypothetical protein PIIN_08375 [Serendipita indica DSM 11827]